MFFFKIWIPAYFELLLVCAVSFTISSWKTPETPRIGCIRIQFFKNWDTSVTMLAAVQGGVVGTQLKSRVGKKIEDVFQITGQMKFQWFPRKK